MDENNIRAHDTERNKSRWGILRIFKYTAIIVFVVAIVVVGWIKYNIYASPFQPTLLSEKEQHVLDSKMFLITKSSKSRESSSPGIYQKPEGYLKPEPYSEKGASRVISLTERELNALVANEPEVARRVAIDLSDEMISVKLVIPLDEEIIFLGGKTLRLNRGIILGYSNGRPIVGVKGISLGGIPLPNAWLGDIKGKNLVEEFGTEHGFWKVFAEGVKDISVEEGRIRIQLKE